MTTEDQGYDQYQQDEYYQQEGNEQQQFSQDQYYDQQYADPNQEYADPNQAYADPNQAYADPNQAYADPNQQYADPNQQYADPNQDAYYDQQEAAQPAAEPEPAEEEEESDDEDDDDLVTRDQLAQYINVEAEIHHLEKEQVTSTLDVKEEAVQDLNETIMTLEIQVSSLAIKTKKEKEDVDALLQENVKGLLENENDYNTKMTKENEEFLEALNEETLARKELDGIKQQQEDMKEEIKKLQEKADKLKNAYEKRDNVLDSVFKGAYGSDIENQLEYDLDMLKDKFQRVAIAHYKWINARKFLQHSVNQLCLAVHRWKEVLTIPNSDSQKKFNCATDCRNNLTAAIQNIEACQRYLSTIAFPYVQPMEVQTLKYATNNIYSDMHTPHRHEHAMCCYDVTYKRANALLHWFNNVIEKTIKADLMVVGTDLQKAAMRLRKERITLIQEGVKASGGSIVGLESTEPDLEGFEINDADFEEGIDIVEAEHVEGLEELTEEPSDMDMPSETPIPLSELAPMPDENDLFGDISKLKEQHQKEKDEFKKMQDLNKARMEQGLQQKMQERRKRQEIA